MPMESIEMNNWRTHLENNNGRNIQVGIRVRTRKKSKKTTSTALFVVPFLLLAHLSLDLVFIFIFVILPIVHKIKGTTHTFIITFHSLPILWQFNFNACIALFYLNIIFYIVSLRKFDFDFLLVSTFLFYIYTRDLSLFIIVSRKIVCIHVLSTYIRVCIFHAIAEINLSIFFLYI
jgi:hypothetical protein